MLDRECYENRSSMCSIVGFFIGYSCAEGKHKAGTTTSRVGEAENKLRWRLIPPLCRKDNVHEKNASLARMRAGHTAEPRSLTLTSIQERSEDWMAAGWMEQ